MSLNTLNPTDRLLLIRKASLSIIKRKWSKPKRVVTKKVRNIIEPRKKYSIFTRPVSELTKEELDRKRAYMREKMRGIRKRKVGSGICYKCPSKVAEARYYQDDNLVYTLRFSKCFKHLSPLSKKKNESP